MKELLETLKEKETGEEAILLDTCFIINLFEKNQEKELMKKSKEKNLAITSFNIQELEHVIKKAGDHHLKKRISDFFKQETGIKKITIPVSPGNKEEEKKYVEETEPELLRIIKDPSDAVLIATAIKEKATTILTKDKHHLFNQAVENYSNKLNIKVYKELKEI